jgi:crotonobetainyl-CoA:carnitine CoA-transferase CaiB-like acyl-CoA transferase
MPLSLSSDRAAPAIGDGIRVRTVAPKIGQHNAEVFGRIRVTGLEIKALREKCV